MAYATQADILTAYGPDALYMADRDGDGAIDADAVTRNLETASSEIDSYIGVRYDLPLAIVPDLVRQFAVDIALYRISSTADVMTEEIRKRYDDAIKALMRISEGKAILIFPEDPNAPVDPDAEPSELSSGPKPIAVGGPERIFSREKMEGL